MKDVQIQQDHPWSRLIFTIVAGITGDSNDQLRRSLFHLQIKRNHHHHRHQLALTSFSSSLCSTEVPKPQFYPPDCSANRRNREKESQFLGSFYEMGSSFQMKRLHPHGFQRHDLVSTSAVTSRTMAAYGLHPAYGFSANRSIVWCGSSLQGLATHEESSISCWRFTFRWTSLSLTELGEHSPLVFAFIP